MRRAANPARIEDVAFNSETPCVGRWIALEVGFH